MRFIFTWILATVGIVAFAAAPDFRSNLVHAILSESLADQVKEIQKLPSANDSFVEQALQSWRGGAVYIYETNGLRIPFVLDTQGDPNGDAHAIRVLDNGLILDEEGKAITFSASELTPVDTNPRLRQVIRTALDLFALGNSNPVVRRDAIVKLGQSQNSDYIPQLENRLSVEVDVPTRRAILEAIDITKMASEDPATRLTAIRRLTEMRSVNSLSFLQKLESDARENPKKSDPETLRATVAGIRSIQDYLWWGNLFGTTFRGISLAAVLLVASLGLAITFGLMGIINMAHGELIMVGAYTAYVIQNVFKSTLRATGLGFDAYFIVALLASFIVAGLVGIILERGIIRFLYKRPLESLLATWGVSLVLQQLFRHIFGAANVQVTSPSWLSGSLVINDVLLAYNRLFVIAFAVSIVYVTYLLLTRTSLGLQIRAVMQNRSMASCVGVRTDRVNMLTFAFGSGLAGMAGACLSQIGNVGPSLGQNYIIDCFMVVVLGGIGNLVGTVSAAVGVGVTDQILQPWLGAVMGKITVLAAIILFLQWRPAGMFTSRSRNLEG